MSTLTTNSVHCLSVFSGDLGSPLLFSLTKNLSLRETEDTQRDEPWGRRGKKDRKTKCQDRRAPPSTESDGERRLQSIKCGTVCGRVVWGGWVGGREGARGRAGMSPSHSATRASSGRMKYSRRRVSPTLSLTHIERRQQEMAPCRGRRRGSKTLGCDSLSTMSVAR